MTLSRLVAMQYDPYKQLKIKVCPRTSAQVLNQIS